MVQRVNLSESVRRGLILSGCDNDIGLYINFLYHYQMNTLNQNSLFFRYPVLIHPHRQINGHEYSIVVVDIPLKCFKHSIVTRTVSL